MLEQNIQKDVLVNIEGEKKKIWVEKILAILSFLNDLCEKNHLRYYVCAGTALGAVRHKGIIPWDDDIDIMMPRKDYETLLRKLSLMKEMPYGLAIPTAANAYYLRYAKVYDKESTLLELKELRYVIGPFVDIFPVDGCHDDEEKTKALFKKYQYYNYYFSITSTYWNRKDYIEHLSKKLYKRAFVQLLTHSLRRFIRYYTLKKMKEIESMYDYDKCAKVITWCGQQTCEREIHDREWMGEGTELPFENLKVKVPSNYDAYLKCMYGDYMTPPPPEKRISHHSVAYINLKARESLNSVRKKIKEMEE